MFSIFSQRTGSADIAGSLFRAERRLTCKLCAPPYRANVLTGVSPSPCIAIKKKKGPKTKETAVNKHRSVQVKKDDLPLPRLPSADREEG